MQIAKKMNSSILPEEILPTIVDIAWEYIGVRRASLFMKKGAFLEAVAATGIELGKIHKVPANQGIMGIVVSTGQEYISSRGSTQSDSGYSSVSFISMPVIVKDEVKGVLNLTDKSGDHFNEQDIELAKYMAFKCGLTIERYELYKEMQQGERLKILGQVKASVAHDIRNIIGIVDVCLSMMQETDDVCTLHEYSLQIKSEMSRMEALTSDITTFIKNKIELVYSVFSLKTMFKELSSSFNILLNYSDMNINCILKDDIKICADRNRLYQAIFNLLNNSMQAIGEKGTIVLKAKQVGKNVEIVVFDNGRGIEKETLKFLFDPLFTKGKSRGTGLGLAIVKEIIKAHSGKIKVRSSLNKYTVFCINLPIEEEKNDGA